jgi:hypothetical protein
LKGKNQESGEIVGVLEDTYMGTTVIKNSGFDLYCPEVDNLLSEGKLSRNDRIYLYYIVDYDLPENTPAMWELNGYATVSMVNYLRFESVEMKYSLTDTSKVLENEYVMIDPLPSANQGLKAFYDKYLYLTHMVSQPEDLQVTWDLSCNGYAIIPTEENGKRYYDLFLRVTKANDVSTTGSNKTTVAHYVSYDVGNYLQRVAEYERAVTSYYDPNTSLFTIRIYYPSNIEGNIYWSYKTWDLGVAGFLPQEN